MGLSSNSLIHLTRSKEFLIGILKEEFRFKYCVEQVKTNHGKFNLAVPMVSFFDVPLSEIKKHLAYGKYGIGLKKKWGEKKGLNPVLYIDAKSTLGGNLLLAYYKIIGERDLSTLSETELRLADVVRYIKNYEYDLIRPGKRKRKNYRFSDEREWRYVPKTDVNAMFVNADEYKTPEEKAAINSRIETLRLGFTPNDITYIIVQRENEISDFVRILRDVKGKKYSPEEVDRLITRIITIDQILSDF